MYIPELDYHCDLCAETLIEADVFPVWSNLVFADSGKELQKRLEKRENFPAELFSNLELWVDGAVVSDRNCSVYVPFVAPISAVMETYSIPLTPELTEGEREYIERLICKELGLEEDE